MSSVAIDPFCPVELIKIALAGMLRSGGSYQPGAAAAITLPGLLDLAWTAEHAGGAAALAAFKVTVWDDCEDVKPQRVANGGRKLVEAGPDVMVHSPEGGGGRPRPAAETGHEMWNCPVAVEFTCPPDVGDALEQEVWTSLLVLLGAAKIHTDEPEVQVQHPLAARLNAFSGGLFHVWDVLEWQEGDPVVQGNTRAVTRGVQFVVRAGKLAAG